MNKKRLAITLSKLKDYKRKKPSLEQYTTPSSIAASLLWKAYMNNDIVNKTVLDAGCGNGVLGVGALMLGAKKVHFVDVDERGLNIVEENCKKHSFENYELVHSNIIDFRKKVNITIMNPPFGVQTRGLDLMFFKHAKSISSKIYAIYKRDGLKILEKEFPNASIKVLEKTELKLNKQFSYHTKPMQETSVILVRISNFYKE